MKIGTLYKFELLMAGRKNGPLDREDFQVHIDALKSAALQVHEHESSLVDVRFILESMLNYLEKTGQIYH